MCFYSAVTNSLKNPVVLFIPSLMINRFFCFNFDFWEPILGLKKYNNHKLLTFCHFIVLGHNKCSGFFLLYKMFKLEGPINPK